METGLRLLMRDGTLHVRFHPKLNSAEYAELMTAVEKPATVAELRATLEQLSEQWGKKSEFEE
jgi:hypothetical protein